MNIIKHGEQSSEKMQTEEFKCGQCGCEFTADYDEYYIERGYNYMTSAALTYTYNAIITDSYVCSCPECHKIVVKTKQRTDSITTFTMSGTDTADGISDYCKNCSNLPSNGGSGNCNCMLGSMGQVTC